MPVNGFRSGPDLSIHPGMTGSRTPSGTHSARRLFAGHAAISLVPVVLIGLLLAHSYAGEAQKRGIAEAQAQAKLIATAVIEPQLNGTDLRDGISPGERARLTAVAQRTAQDGTILRMRLRDLDGRVVFVFVVRIRQGFVVPGSFAATSMHPGGIASVRGS